MKTKSLPIVIIFIALIRCYFKTKAYKPDITVALARLWRDRNDKLY